jgi:putative cardiolipin synthase
MIRTRLINRRGCVARDLRLLQGAKRNHIRTDLRPTSNAAVGLKICNPLGLSNGGPLRRGTRTHGWRRLLVGFFGFVLVSQTGYADKALILENPRDAVQARVDLIQHARSSIDAQYYVVGNDDFTLEGLALLRDAARRGCQVRIIVDGRSNMLSKAVHAELRREHVLVKLYHPVTLGTLHLLLHRMHDKGLNIDRRCMIRGGRNAEGDYFGYWKHNFVDRDVYVEGSAVTDSVVYFDRLWNSAEVAPVAAVQDATGARADEGRKILDAAKQKLRSRTVPRMNSGIDWSAKAREVGRVEFLHDPVGKKNIEFGIAQALRLKLRQTRHSVLIETPYLVPTNELMTDLSELRSHGVTTIRIITNSSVTNDDVLVSIGYEAAKKKLLNLGVDLWEYNGPETIHAKSAVLDDKLALIGSFNMDYRSQRLNTETAVAISNAKTAHELRRNIYAHKAKCTHITPEHLGGPDLATMPLSERIKRSFQKLLLPLVHA